MSEKKKFQIPDLSQLDISKLKAIADEIDAFERGDGAFETSAEYQACIDKFNEIMHSSEQSKAPGFEQMTTTCLLIIYFLELGKSDKLFLEYQKPKSQKLN
jgi:hypothetical protein